MSKEMIGFYRYVINKINELEKSKSLTEFGEQSLRTLKKTIRQYDEIVK